MRGIPIKDEQGRIEECLGSLTDIQDFIAIAGILDRTRTGLAISLKDQRPGEAETNRRLEELQAIDEALRESEARARIGGRCP